MKEIIVDGYRAFYMPDHPRAFGNGVVYEHILVAEKMLGRPLKESEVVHHKDKNRLNNNEYNLMVFASDRDHATYHSGKGILTEIDGIYYCKNPDKYYFCIDCGKEIHRYRAKRCPACANKNHRKVERPSKETLLKYLTELHGNFTRIGALCGVTDNAVRTWCKLYELPYHSKDYCNFPTNPPQA